MVFGGDKRPELVELDLGLPPLAEHCETACPFCPVERPEALDDAVVWGRYGGQGVGRTSLGASF